MRVAPARDVAAHHGADHLGGVGLVAVHRGDVTAVAKHRQPVGDGEDLVDAVRDVNHRGAGGAEFADDPEEPRHLGVGKRRRGFVHDDDRRVEGQRPGDLDHLPIAHAEVADRGSRVDPGADPFENPPRGRFHLSIVEQPEPAAQFASQKDVGGDGKRRHQVQLLVNDPDARVLGGTGTGEPHGPAVKKYLPVIRADRPGENLHERALARPVLAAKRVDLARVRLEMDVGQGLHATEVLRDVLEPEALQRSTP